MSAVLWIVAVLAGWTAAGVAVAVRFGKTVKRQDDRLAHETALVRAAARRRRDLP